MDNKSNLTPELKAIYDRVMSTASNSKASAQPATQPPVTQPATAIPTDNTLPKPFTTPTFPYVATVPVIKVDASNIEDSIQDASQNDSSTKPNDTKDPNIVDSDSIAPLSSMVGTITSGESKKSKKPLFIGISALFIMVWTGLWAVVFGFIKI